MPIQTHSMHQNHPYCNIVATYTGFLDWDRGGHRYFCVFDSLYQSEGVSSVWPRSVFACWWLCGVALVGSSSPLPFSSASLPGFFRLTLWPRLFYHPRNYLRNQAGNKKHMWGNAGRLFARNSDVRLAGIVI